MPFSALSPVRQALRLAAKTSISSFDAVVKKDPAWILFYFVTRCRKDIFALNKFWWDRNKLSRRDVA